MRTVALFGLGVLLLAAVFLGAKAASVGIVAAFVGGATQLTLMLLAVAVALFVAQITVVRRPDNGGRLAGEGVCGGYCF